MYLQRLIKPKFLSYPYNYISLAEKTGNIYNFPDEEIRVFQKLFFAYDCERKGSLNMWEFNDFLRGTLGRRVGTVDLNRIFSYIDKNHDKVIQFLEILGHFERRLAPQPEADVRRSFSLMDKDNDGRLTLGETRLALLYLGEDYGNPRVRNVFIKLDEDNDGEINMAAYKKLLADEGRKRP